MTIGKTVGVNPEASKSKTIRKVAGTGKRKDGRECEEGRGKRREGRGEREEALLDGSPGFARGCGAEPSPQGVHERVDFTGLDAQRFVGFGSDQLEVAAGEKPVVDFEQGPSCTIKEAGVVKSGPPPVAFRDVRAYGPGCATKLPTDVRLSPVRGAVRDVGDIESEGICLLPGDEASVGEPVHAAILRRDTRPPIIVPLPTSLFTLHSSPVADTSYRSW